MEELRRAPDEELSFPDAANVVSTQSYCTIDLNAERPIQSLEIQYTAGPNIATNLYHVPLVRGQLTRNLHVLFPAIRDELISACNDLIPACDGEPAWCLIWCCFTTIGRSLG